MDNKKKANKRRDIIIFVFIIVMLSFPSPPTHAFSDQVIQKGATGDDVVELQARLQYIGFYRTDIDGVFGWGTYWALRNYQKEFGMEVTGLVGDKTKAMLEKSTEFDKEWVHQNLREGRKFTHYGTTPKDIQRGPKGSKDKQQPSKDKQQPSKKKPAADQGKGEQKKEEIPPTPQDEQEKERTAEPDTAPVPQEKETKEEVAPPAEEKVKEQKEESVVQSAINVPEGYTDNDINLMAQAVYGESRGEPYIGQVAIAAVILNRVQSPTFPNTVSGVIFEPRAFTAVTDGQIYMTPNDTAKKAVLDAINGQDPTGNALYYFNPDTATNKWIWSRPQIKKIGKHIFCK